MHWELLWEKLLATKMDFPKATHWVMHWVHQWGHWYRVRVVQLQLDQVAGASKWIHGNVQDAGVTISQPHLAQTGGGGHRFRLALRVLKVSCDAVRLGVVWVQPL